MNPIIIDLSGLQGQFGLASDKVDLLTESCVNAVTSAIQVNWEALAKSNLNSTAPEYIKNIIRVDKGRFEKQIILTGVVSNMLEQGASAFDMKKNFKKSNKVKHSIVVYDKKGNKKSGGSWYLTIPFRIGVPGTLGQAGFSGQLPQEVYDLIRKRASASALPASEIPSPHDIPQSREAIVNEQGMTLFNKYTHKNSLYEGLTKRTAQYERTSQNTYGTFRRAGENSDPLSWIHKGLMARNFAQRAVEETDVDSIVENEVTEYLETIL